MRETLPRGTLLVGLLVLGLLPPGAIGQGTTFPEGAPSGSSFHQRYQEGRAAYDAGHWQEALTLFRELEVHESAPPAPVRFAIGGCLVRLAMEERDRSKRNDLLREAIGMFRAAKRSSDHAGLTWEMIETNILVAKSLYRFEPIEESTKGEKRLVPDEGDADAARRPNDEEGGLPVPAKDDLDGEEGAAGEADRTAIDQGEVSRPAPGLATSDPGPIDPTAARARLRALGENSGSRPVPAAWGPARSPRDF